MHGTFRFIFIVFVVLVAIKLEELNSLSVEELNTANEFMSNNFGYSYARPTCCQKNHCLYEGKVDNVRKVYELSIDNQNIDIVAVKERFEMPTPEYITAEKLRELEDNSLRARYGYDNKRINAMTDAERASIPSIQRLRTRYAVQPVGETVETIPSTDFKEVKCNISKE